MSGRDNLSYVVSEGDANHLNIIVQVHQDAKFEKSEDFTILSSKKSMVDNHPEDRDITAVQVYIPSLTSSINGANSKDERHTIQITPQLHHCNNVSNFRMIDEENESKSHFPQHPPYTNQSIQIDSSSSSSQVITTKLKVNVDGNEFQGSYSNPNLDEPRNSKHFLIRIKKIVFKYCITYPLLLTMTWALLYIFWGDIALPDGKLFALFILEIASISLGHFCSIIHLPPLTGMLCAGLCLRNFPQVNVNNVAKHLSHDLTTLLRGISVVILLTRGAFSVNIENIKKFKKTVPSLVIGACFIEAVCASTSAYFIIGFPPAWSASVGCIMSAMSGVVVMPYLQNIESRIKNPSEHPSLLDAINIAKTACGLDAILGICMTECCFGFIFANEDLKLGLSKGAAEVALGGAFGIMWGLFCGFLLAESKNQDLKLIFIFSGGVMSLIGLSKLGYPRGGPLGTFGGTLIAITIWRLRSSNWNNVTEAFDKLWSIFQPILFGVIGARVDFQEVEWTVIFKGIICLGIGLMGRMIGCFIMTSWSRLPLKERIFLVVTWLGKGTVQAALGPVLLETALNLGLKTHVNLASQILHLSVMCILVSSVIGSLTLKLLGIKLLRYGLSSG